MNKIFAIARKELTAYFKSPVAYIVLVITISAFNVFFYLIIGENREASLRDMFRVMEFMFVFIVPILTMGIFSEEKRTGTMEFLMTTPTTNTEIVLGKYLGSLTFFTVIVGITFIYYPIIEFFGQPDLAATLSGYVGIWLEGALFIAVGMLVSSWTRSQIVAAISSYGVLFLLYFSTTFTRYLSSPAETLVRYAGTASHTQNFAVGLVTPGDLIYFLSGIFACILLTIPFGAIGVIYGLWALNSPMGFVAILGILSLTGMMIKNMIVLTDAIKQAEASGMHPFDACVRGAVTQARPIALAAGTTVLGVIPLFPDPFWNAMAAAIMAGLTVGATLTIVLYPTLYATLHQIHPPETSDAT